MKTLDCESIESTYKSLENILDIKESRIHKLYDSIDICDDSCSGIEPTQRLFSYVIREAHCKVEFDATCWFHFTRTQNSNTFEEGILPLKQALPKLLDFLFELSKEQFTPQQWEDFKHSIDSIDSHWAKLFKMKMADAKLHGGPHAFLVKEAAIKGIRDSHLVNYFRTPEIIEDICYCCADKYGIDLIHKFRANTSPCIVKLIDYTSNTKALCSAMIYSYHKHHNLGFSLDCNYGFSAKGTTVPKDRIINMDFLSEKDEKTLLA